MNNFKTAIIFLFGLFSYMAVAQESTEMTNEQRDAAWTAEDTKREAAQRVPAAADPVSVDVLGTLIGKADVIFRGVVQSQSVDYDTSGIAYTRTTFNVTDDLKGSMINGDSFTLVQEGGPGQFPGAPSMMSSNSRYFNVGEEELLLLGTEVGNGVREVQIRFRIHHDRVFDEDGRGVFVIANKDGNGHILRLSSDRNPAALFSEIRIGSQTLYKNFSDKDKGSKAQEGEGANGAGVSDAVAGPGYTEGASVSTLISAIKN